MSLRLMWPIQEDVGRVPGMEIAQVVGMHTVGRVEEGIAGLAEEIVGEGAVVEVEVEVEGVIEVAWW